MRQVPEWGLVWPTGTMLALGTGCRRPGGPEVGEHEAVIARPSVASSSAFTVGLRCNSDAGDEARGGHLIEGRDCRVVEDRGSAPVRGQVVNDGPRLPSADRSPW